MVPTPTDEIRAIRRELAARSGNDVHRIAEETRQRQLDSGHTFISLPGRAPQHEGGPNEARHRTGAACRPSPLRRSPNCPGR